MSGSTMASLQSAKTFIQASRSAAGTQSSSAYFRVSLRNHDTSSESPPRFTIPASRSSIGESWITRDSDQVRPSSVLS
jgi:hypothetical protein